MKTLRKQIQDIRQAFNLDRLIEAEILLFLAENPEGAETTDIAQALACPHSTAFAMLRRFKDECLVDQHGTRPRPSTWILTQNGRNLLSNHLPRPASADSGENPPPVSHQSYGVVTTGGATISEP